MQFWPICPSCSPCRKRRDSTPHWYPALTTGLHGLPVMRRKELSCHSIDRCNCLSSAQRTGVTGGGSAASPFLCSGSTGKALFSCIMQPCSYFLGSIQNHPAFTEASGLRENRRFEPLLTPNKNGHSKKDRRKGLPIGFQVMQVRPSNRVMQDFRCTLLDLAESFHYTPCYYWTSTPFHPNRLSNAQPSPRNWRSGCVCLSENFDLWVR